MKKNILGILLSSVIVLTQFSCTKDDAPAIPPSEGETLKLNGGTGGASAVNTVYLDLSTDKVDSVKRNSWDLAFYTGSSFRVTLNMTKGASGVVVNKTDINSVSASDITLSDIGIGLGTAGAFGNIDDVLTMDINNTLIDEISATEALNKVYVINPEGGTHSSSLTLDKLIKVRILRKGNGYTLQYASLNETSFKSFDIVKDVNYNFRHFSFTTNSIVPVEPERSKWDIVWTWSIYYGGTGVGAYPYSYSDLVFVNKLGGVQATELVYSTSIIRDQAYNLYSTDSVAKVSFSNNYDVMGSKWRATTGSIGVKTDRFYLIKDLAGNVYKLKFISFTAQDGGERGKPEIEYKLVKKG